uniref:SCP domain-containing protein n=1 Tax=Parascaris univalens TaxID=6257 RepID=A0A914ZWM8_PARUN
MIYSATFPVILLLLADVSSLTSAASQTCSSKVLTDDERLLILEEHNSRRSRLAKGLEKTAKWTAPQASEMYKMVYDCQLEKWAQKHADRCYFKHSEDRHDVGENIYKSTDTKSSKFYHLKKAAELWWRELEEVESKSSGPLIFKGQLSIGHFTQMAWYKTVNLGCGISSSCPEVYVVCQYSPAGNSRNQMVYPVATSHCTKDADCRYYNGSTCDVDEGLCITDWMPKKPAKPIINGVPMRFPYWIRLSTHQTTATEMFITITYFTVASVLLGIA